MGERALSLGRIALIAGCLGALPAQGPVYRERWGFLFLEQRRQEIRRELEGRDAALRQRVAELLAAPALGLPFQAEAKALAALRGVPADPAFVLRCALGVFPLPEVVDPEAKNELCRALNASVFLPVTVADPGSMVFDLAVRDTAGAERWRGTLTQDTTVPDLRMARPSAQVPAGDFADGNYELQVVARIDGAGPRGSDPALRVRFQVLRGYQARAEAAMAAAKQREPELPPLQQALLQGLRTEVERAYYGEAYDGTATGVQDLERLERGLANLAVDRHVLTGCEGLVATMVPGDAGPLRAVLRLSPERRPAALRPAVTAPRPLVVFAGGSPAYDLDGMRPAAPRTRSPRWLAQTMAEFGAQLGIDVAWLESTGHGRNHARELAAALASLRELLDARAAPLLLVAEREAAAVVGLHSELFAAELAGLVLVGGGGMPLPALERYAQVPIRLGRLVGSRGDEAQVRLVEHAARLRSAGQPGPDLQWLTELAAPWPFAMETLAAPIAAFVDEVCAKRAR